MSDKGNTVLTTAIPKDLKQALRLESAKRGIDMSTYNRILLIEKMVELGSYEVPKDDS